MSGWSPKNDLTVSAIVLTGNKNTKSIQDRPTWLSRCHCQDEIQKGWVIKRVGGPPKRMGGGTFFILRPVSTTVLTGNKKGRRSQKMSYQLVTLQGCWYLLLGISIA